MTDVDKFSSLVLSQKKSEAKLQLFPQFKREILIGIEISYSEGFNLSLLKEFSSLQSIRLSNNYMKRIDFTLLPQRPKLRKIEVIDCVSLQNIEFGDDIAYESLVTLRISRTDISNLNLDFLERSPLLQELHLQQISNTNYIEKGYSRYSWWYKRRYYQDCEEEGYDRYDLEITEYPSRLKMLDLRFLDDHPNLRVLDLSYNEETSFIFQKHPPKMLEYVNLSHNTIEELEFSWFISRNIRSINLERSGVGKLSLEGIQAAQSIRELNLKHNSITALDLIPLKDLDGIESIDLSRNRLQSIDLTPIQTFRYLKYLILESNDLERIDLRPLRELPLTHILIGDCKLTEVDLSPLTSLKNLQVLRLTRNRLEEIDLSPLAGLKFLKKIQLARNQLRSLSLEPLRGKQYLNELNLDRNPFEEVNMDALKSIPHIDFIDITYASEKSKIDITPILRNHSHSWVNVGEDENFKVNVKELNDINLDGNPLIDHPSVLEAIDFKENAKDILGARTKAFAIKAVENHDDVIDLLTQRMMEERMDVSNALVDRIREMRKTKDNSQKSGGKTNSETSH